MQRKRAESNMVKLQNDPDVYWVRVPYPMTTSGATNCFLVVSEGECLVVDVGGNDPEGYRVLRDALDSVGIPPSSAKYALTHLHVDHAGGANDFIPPGVTIYVGKRAMDGMQNWHDGSYVAFVHERAAQEGVRLEDIAAVIESPHLVACDVSGDHDVRSVEEGDLISVGACRFAVMETPGHTPGHIAFHDAEHGILVTGDAMLHELTPTLCFSRQSEGVLDQYLSTLDRLAATGVDQMCISHGDVRPGCVERCRRIAEHCMERVSEVEQWVVEHPGCTGAEAIFNVRWNIVGNPSVSFHGYLVGCMFQSGLAYLDYLVRGGRVRRDVAGGVARYWPN